MYFCKVQTGSALANRYAYSTDGVTWTESTLLNMASATVVRVGSTYIMYVSSTLNTSSDLATWTAQTVPSGGAFSRLVSNGTIAVMMNTTSGVTKVTTDGITWLTGSMPYTGLWTAPVWNGSVFCTVIPNSTKSAVSTDGVTWTSGVLPDVRAWNIPKWNGSVFYTWASYAVTPNFAQSSDGITWTGGFHPVFSIGTTYSSMAGSAICIFGDYSGDGGVSTTAVASSTDNGASWSSISYLPTNLGFNNLAREIPAVNNTSTMLAQSKRTSTQGYIGSSVDGITWTVNALPTTVGSSFACWYDGNKIVGVCDSSDFYADTITAMSTDSGATWTTGNLSVSGRWRNPISFDYSGAIPIIPTSAFWKDFISTYEIDS